MASAAIKSRGKCNSSLWTKAKTLQLITLFESQSELWKVSNPLYTNRNHKRNLQNQIADILEVDATEVASKMHNLRCQYNAELRKLKMKRSGHENGELYTPRWEFFNALRFLSNGSRRSSSILPANLKLKSEFHDTSVQSPPSPSSSTSSDPFSNNFEVFDARSVNDYEVTRENHTPSLYRDTPEKSQISDYVEAKLQYSTDDRWKKIFADYIHCELDRYHYEDAQRLKSQLTRVCLDFQPTQSTSFLHKTS